MITDVHTHFWLPTHQSEPWSQDLKRVSKKLGSDKMTYVSAEEYLEGLGKVDKSIVFGLQARAAGIFVPNDDVADFVSKLNGRAIGFLSVDPTDRNACDEIERSVYDLGLKGIKLGPLYQGTSPLDPLVLRVFALAEKLNLPVMIHQGAVFSNAGRLANAYPIFLDDVAIAFPNLKIIIAHLGHPWFHETVVVMRRNPNVFADTSALPSRPTVLLSALTYAKEYGVLNKVLFGSDSPMVTTQSALDRLQEISEYSQKHGLTKFTGEDLDLLLHRPTLELLELA